MPRTRIEKTLFILILCGYLFAGATYAIFTPRWQAPDEPAHYNYIRQVAEVGCCPLIKTGDWDKAYLDQLTSARFADELLGELDSIQYEDHHPPLYYLLASVVYKLVGGDLITLRLFTMLIGAGVVSLSHAIARRILPEQPQIALGVMALVAFLPQHLSMLSAVNNDALAELVVALSLLWLVRYSQGEHVPIWQLGLLTGVAFLTKLTIYFLALLIPLVIWLKWRRSGNGSRELVRALATFAFVAGIIGGIWWLRNISAYPGPDLLGLAAHDAVVADQPRTADYIADKSLPTYLAQFASVTFKSFWGQFGWMALPLDHALGGWIYRGFGLLLLVGLSGALLGSRARAPATNEGGSISAESWISLARVGGLGSIAVYLLQL